MTPCKCGNATYLDLSSVRRCRSCDRVPSWCKCQPAHVAFVPVWRRQLPARDETGRLAA